MPATFRIRDGLTIGGAVSQEGFFGPPASNDFYGFEQYFATGSPGVHGTILLENDSRSGAIMWVRVLRHNNVEQPYIELPIVPDGAATAISVKDIQALDIYFQLTNESGLSDGFWWLLLDAARND